MHDAQAQQKFIELRAQGWTFARIVSELSISKPTLIAWSRKFQFQIQNLRAIEAETLLEKYLATRAQRMQTLGIHLGKIEHELSKRDVSQMTTGRLYSLAAALRNEIKREAGPIQFSTPVSEIPNDEYHEQVQDWSP